MHNVHFCPDYGHTLLAHVSRDCAAHRQRDGHLRFQILRHLHGHRRWSEVGMSHPDGVFSCRKTFEHKRSVRRSYCPECNSLYRLQGWYATEKNSRSGYWTRV